MDPTKLLLGALAALSFVAAIVIAAFASRLEAPFAHFVARFFGKPLPGRKPSKRPLIIWAGFFFFLCIGAISAALMEILDTPPTVIPPAITVIAPTNVSNITPTKLESTASPPLATTPKLSIEPILVLHEVFSNSMGCINGDLWVLPSDSKDAEKIGIGKRFDPSTIRDLVYVGPLMAYFKIGSLQPSGEETTVTDIAVSVISYTPSDTKVLLIGRSTICADPRIPITNHQFYSRIKANTGALSLTRPRETGPAPKLFSIDTQSPLVFGVHLNAVEPGWYEFKLVLSYTHDGMEESIIADRAVVMYVPDESEITEVYLADDLENGAIKIFGDPVTLLEDLKITREERVVITSLESSLTNPAITGEYLLIQNLGKQQDLTGWKIETLFTDGQTFVFPNFTLPEWASVRVWSGRGNNGTMDLYWNLDSVIWSVNNKSDMPLVAFNLNDASGNEVSGYTHDKAQPVEILPDTATWSPEIILYSVIHVSSNDVLNIRAGAGVNYEVVGNIPYNGRDIQIVGDGVQANNATWVPILYNGITGWVNSYYLTQQ